MSDTTTETGQTPAAPALRVVKGDPTPEELAALLLVVAAASGGQEETGTRRRASVWAHPARKLRQNPPRGHALAWRAATR